VFLLDTGALANLVRKPFASSLLTTETDRIHGLTLGGKMAIKDQAYAQIRIGDGDVERHLFLTAGAQPPSSSRDLEVAGFLGLPWITKRRILLSPDGKYLHFSNRER
jgi:hypothetical protein